MNEQAKDDSPASQAFESLGARRLDVMLGRTIEPLHDTTLFDVGDPLPTYLFSMDNDVSVSARTLAEIPEPQEPFGLNFVHCLNDEILRSLTRFSNLAHLRFWLCDSVTDAGVGAIADIPNLVSLSFGNSKGLTPNAFRQLSKASQLKYLQLDSVEKQLDDTSCKYLAAFDQLSGLSIQGPAPVFDHDLSDRGMGSLGEFPKLTQLSLLSCKHLTDRGIRAITASPQLRALRIQLPLVTDQTCEEVARNGNLRFLDAELPQMGDRGLDAICGQANLKTLTVRHADGVTDNGLRGVSRLVKLQCLDLFMLKGITDISLASISRLPQLRSLTLAGCKRVSDEGIAALEKVNLESLNLADTSASDKACASIARMPLLRSLQLNGTQIGDQGVHALAALPGLIDLGVHSTKVTMEGLRWIAKHRHLKRLDLGWLSVTDEGAAVIARSLPELIELNLEAADITARGLKSLATLPSLEDLYLYSCSELDYESLLELKSFPALRCVQVYETSIDYEQVEALRRELPTCEVDY